MNSILKDIRSINMDRKGLFDGQAELVVPNESDCSIIHAILSPNSGPFRDGEIRFELTIPSNFPASSPKAKCLDKIFHPNVSLQGGVCFNMFGSDGWCQSYSLEAFVVGLLWLLSNPNPDSCLNGAAAIRDPKLYEETVQKCMLGIPHNGEMFSILNKNAHVQIALSAWFSNRTYNAWETPRWYCEEAKPYVDIYNQLTAAGQSILSISAASVEIRGSSRTVQVSLKGGKLNTQLPLESFLALDNPSIFGLSEEEASYLPSVEALRKIGHLRVVARRPDGCYNFEMSQIVVSGRFVDGYVELELKSCVALQNPSGAAWLNSPLVRCGAMEIPNRCMGTLRTVVTVNDVQCVAEGKYTIFVYFQGSLFACPALLDKKTVEIPFDLYRRLSNEKFAHLNKLICPLAAATEELRAKLTALNLPVIDVLSSPDGYTLRFARGGTARFMNGSKQVIVDFADWVKLGQPLDELFKIESCPSLKYVENMHFVTTTLKASTQLTEASRVLPDGTTETAVLVTPQVVPIELGELGSGWTLTGPARLSNIFTSPLVVLDPLVFQLTCFLHVKDQIFAKFEPDETLNFFKLLANDTEVRLASLHSSIPEADQYLFCHAAPIPLATFLPPVKQAA